MNFNFGIVSIVQDFIFHLVPIIFHILSYISATSVTSVFHIIISQLDHLDAGGILIQSELLNINQSSD